MPFRLVGSVNDRPVSLTLRPGLSVVGSASECDLRVDHPTVSRRHAELTVDEEGVEVVDLGSRNGTLVGPDKITRRRAGAGDRIAFGRALLLLEWVSDDDIRAAVALPAAGPLVPDTEASEAPTTLGTRALDAFALDHFPDLIRRLIEGADETGMAEAGGAALFEALPALEVEVTTRVGDEVGILFRARRDATPPAQVGEVVCGDGVLSLRAVFAHPNTSRLFRPVVEAALNLIRLAARKPAQPRPADAPPPLPEPASVVPEVRRLYADAARVARGDVGVFVCGESGTGKEVLARYIHAASPRSKGPFVALNCAALPRDLLESELFGIERGVATGVEARAGKFELAHAGTLFLDEIGDMSVETQARILRVLQEGEVYRIGGTLPRPAAVRVVAATNHDIKRLLAEGRFREDLYYRIATWVAGLPPLRQRKADIPNLAAHFLAREAARRGVRVHGISRAALDQVLSYDWPGNIRQLENEMSRAVLFLADGELLDTSRLGPELRAGRAPAPGASLAAVLAQAEREEILKALEAHGGDVPAAAKALGLTRSTLYRRLKALGIEPPRP